MRYVVLMVVSLQLLAMDRIAFSQESSATPPSAEEQALLAELANASARNGRTAPTYALTSSAFRAAFGEGNVIDGNDQFVSTRGGATFTWSMPERYDDSWRAWTGLRTVSVSEPSEHYETVYGYSPSFVHSHRWPITLDGCRTKTPNGGAARISWIIRQGPAEVLRNSGGCMVNIGLPHPGVYNVTMEATGPAGWRDSVTGSIHVKDLLILSLGDSMASGEGNPDNEGLDVGWVYRRCHRSKTSGHALAARELEQHSSQSSVTFLSFACSGAGLGTGVLAPYAGQSPLYHTSVPPNSWETRDLDAQIAAAREALCSVPVEECEAEHMRQPDFILLSAGVNDLGFSTVLKACANLELSAEDLAMLAIPGLDDLFEDDCDEAVEVENLIYGGLFSLESKDRLRPPDGRFTFGELRRRLHEAHIAPRDGIYLTTYPAEPFASGTCLTFRNIDGDEVDFIHESGRRLNELIHLEAIGNGFYSVPGITKAFEGHGYCSPSSYFVDISDSLANQLDLNGPMHPNRRGHEAIRDAYLAAIASEKPDRQPTHRVTVIVQRVRFDVPAYPEISARLQFGLVPYEVVENEELSDDVAPVMWKRVVKNREVAAVTAGEWIEFAEPLRFIVDAAPSEDRINFFAGARVDMVGGPDGGVLQRTRVPTPPTTGGDDDRLDPDRGAVGFYQVLHYGFRSDGQSNYGSGRYQRRGATDLGQNPGSMTVEFCVVTSPLNSGPQFPISDAAVLECPALPLRN